MKSHLPSQSFASKLRIRGFSLLEILMVLAAISCVVAMGMIHLMDGEKSVKSVKLAQDVKSLNNAVRTYYLSGGKLSAANTADAVIAKLKSVSAASQRNTIAGLRGTMVDVRLRGVASAEDGTERAVWDQATMTFGIANSGSGIKEFVLDVAAVPAVPVEETRGQVLAMDNADKWIWSYNDNAAATTAPRLPATAIATPVTTSTAAANITVLQAPAFSKPGALYAYNDFNPDMKVSLVDPNPPNSAQIYYSISNGAWIPWNGTPLSIPRALTTEVRTYSAPLDPDRFEESALNSAAYETIYFGGTSSGTFSNPIGDPGMVTNLTNGAVAPNFTWGSAATSIGFTTPNSLTFAGKNLGTIAPEDTFELGTLTYFNGTVWTGTMANSVVLNVALNLTTPGVVENLAFTFKLMSTVNTKLTKIATPGNTETETQMDDADADFVYIPDVSTKFNTTIKGQVFYLILSFGAHSADGFTTINTFHTHENKTMTGKIYGRFTTTPPA
ncbi:MAG: hypothetical protein JWL81_1297 [Verrucomicrobiales bacterium]|nr:hypothetical protein [Verrucomicrobiales bacterium]